MNVLVELRADGIKDIDQNMDVFENQVSIGGQVVIEWIVLPSWMVSLLNRQRHMGNKPSAIP